MAMTCCSGLIASLVCGAFESSSMEEAPDELGTTLSISSWLEAGFRMLEDW